VGTSVLGSQLDSANVIHRYETVYEIPDSFNGQDSVKIRYYLYALLLIKNPENINDSTKGFSWQDSLYVHLER
jgi:hypothetical protein